MLTSYHDEDRVIKYSHLDCINIAEDYGSAAIEAMRKAFGRVVAAPDCEDSRRLYESIGGKLLIDIMDAGCLDRGYGVYEFC